MPIKQRYFKSCHLVGSCKARKTTAFPEPLFSNLQSPSRRDWAASDWQQQVAEQGCKPRRLIFGEGGGKLKSVYVAFPTTTSDVVYPE